MAGKILIIYFSVTSHTRQVAELIQKAVGGELASIRTRFPYPDDMDEMSAQGHREVNSGFLPELNDFPVDMRKYDTIFLGTPVWWYSITPAMKSFLKEHDFSGKTVYPFVTHEGSAGHSLNDFSADLENCFVKTGLTVRFSGSRRITRAALIGNWAKGALRN